jgi:hypothetical protein
MQHCQAKNHFICVLCKQSYEIEDVWILVSSILVIAAVRANFTKIYVEG